MTNRYVVEPGRNVTLDGKPLIRIERAGLLDSPIAPSVGDGIECRNRHAGEEQ